MEVLCICIACCICAYLFSHASITITRKSEENPIVTETFSQDDYDKAVTDAEKELAAVFGKVDEILGGEYDE